MPAWWMALIVALIAITSVAQIILHGRREYRRGWMQGSSDTHQAALDTIRIWGENERAKIRGDQ